MSNIRVHVIIKGRVQGVWFRDSTRREAIALGVTGWVKNLPGSAVEVVAEGPEGRVEKLVSWCHKGSDTAKVSHVEKTREKWKGEFDSFNIVF